MSKIRFHGRIQGSGLGMFADNGDAAVITPHENGPLLVRGTFRITDTHGNEIDPGRRTVALCRCGGSARKPFCDGSHDAIGFSAASGDERVPQATSQRPRAVCGQLHPHSAVSDSAEQDALPDREPGAD
jgi:CDGSH-type Zn-finger protein